MSAIEPSFPAHLAGIATFIGAMIIHLLLWDMLDTTPQRRRWVPALFVATITLALLGFGLAITWIDAR